MKLLSWAITAVTLAVAAHSVSAQPTARGVVPTTYPGNSFINENDPCLQMWELGLIQELTDDMIGVKVEGFGPYSDDYVTTIVTGQKFLDFSLNNAVMVGVIVKGGNQGYNFYNYEPFEYSDDQDLHAPEVTAGSIADISNYIMCYQPGGGPPCLQCLEQIVLNECTLELNPVLIAAEPSALTVDCHRTESICKLTPVCEVINGETVCVCPDESCWGYVPGC
eukprot:CAMPEP_0184699338 /NCGR_PEP_ID=MMETSP0313-20130426/5646_1 /TAXON_ID=2792 /ORGANISM="Porphyridium aerugineum, Strain SAG 1380-2" /LENGTH=221 /DNA_ID=CAMNT_0027158411 /DNA_START=168 /DNA_END=833 /DNA_ORIENTATION=-